MKKNVTKITALIGILLSANFAGAQNPVISASQTLICSGQSVAFSTNNFLNQGLVAYYPFNGNANDLSGNGYHATTNGVTLATDRFGKANSCYAFAGTSTYLTCPPAKYFYGNYTISGWVNINAVENWCRMIDFGNGAGSDNVLVALSVGNSQQIGTSVYAGGSGSDVQSTQMLTLNQWVQITVTLDGNTRSVYFNGVFVDQTMGSYIPNNLIRNNNYIGLSNWGGDGGIHGSMDDIRIYDRSLNPLEVTQLYNYENTAEAQTSYSWSNGGTNSFTSTTPSVTTTYTVTQTRDGATSSNSVQVVVGLTDQTVTASPNSGICSANFTASTTSSQIGINYYLRNNADNSIIEGPIAGTGNPINFNSFNVNNTTTYNVYAEKLSLGLDFNGINDYAVIPANSGINNQFSANQITTEGWFYPTAAAVGTYPVLIGESYLGDGTVKFSMYQNETTLYAGFYDNGMWYQVTTPISLNQWQHFACSYDQSNLKLYVDGILVSSAPLTIPLPVSNEEWRLGRRWDANSNEFYKGKMDEIRIWNVARTQTEIQAAMNLCLTGAESNLVVYYDFEEGSGNTLFDISGGNHNATVINPSTAWVSGKNNCSACTLEMTAKPTITITPISNQTVTASPNTLCISGTSTISINSSESGLNYFLRDNSTNSILVGPLAGTGNALSFATGTISSTTNYNILAEKNINTGVLTFDGVDDYVNIPMNSNLQFGTGDFTFEAWINNTSAPVQVILGSVGGGQDYWMGIDNGHAAVSISGIPACVGTSTVNDGVWHHISGVRQAGNLSIYVNGVLENTISNTTFASPTSDLAIGMFGGGGGFNFAGEIDEVRIWNVARTQSEIQNAMNTSLIGNEPNLLAYYSFNDGMGSSVLSDITTSNNNGTLTNMDIAADWATRIIAECSLQMSLIPSVTVYTVVPTITVNSGEICAGQSFTMVPGGAVTYTLSSGSAIVTPTADATYSVNGTDANGCVSSVNAISSVTVNALPTISVNSGSICAGQSFTMVPIGADSYVYSGGSDIVTPTTDATYSVSGTDANGCVSSIDAVSSVTVNALPTISVNSGAICSGSSFTMIPSGAATYTYSNGSDIVSPTSDATYSVSGTDGNGCTSSIDAVSSVTVNALPTISVNSGAVCAGQSFTMVPAGAMTYTYSSGSDIVTPTSGATYSVSGTDANGCVSTIDAVSSVTVNALPSLMTMTSNTLLCSGETATLSVTGANSYTWSTTETTMDIAVTPTTQTTYTVDGTDANGCSNTATITQDVSLCTGIVSQSGVDASLINLYPNPNNGVFIVELSTTSQVSITNSLGQVILTETMSAGKQNLDIQNQATGIYFVKVIQQDKQHIIKLIKE